MDAASLRADLERFAADLTIAGEPAIFDVVVARHLPVFVKAAHAGLTAPRIAKLLARTSSRRADGTPITADQIRASISRAKRRSAATLFAITLRWLPAAGNNLSGYTILPSCTLALALLPDLSRVARNAVVRTLQDFYPTYGRIKGQSWARIVFGHALRPTLVPIVAYFGPLVAHTIGGLVVIDVLFSLDGLGTRLIDSVRRQFLCKVSARRWTSIGITSADSTLVGLPLGRRLTANTPRRRSRVRQRSW